MPATLKLNKGFAKRLSDVGKLSPEMSRDLSGDELTAEIVDPQLLIQKHPGKPPVLEISDVGGSFGLWIDLRADKVRRLKEIIKDM